MKSVTQSLIIFTRFLRMFTRCVVKKWHNRVHGRCSRDVYGELGQLELLPFGQIQGLTGIRRRRASFFPVRFRFGFSLLPVNRGYVRGL